jgi:hypothetical protein
MDNNEYQKKQALDLKTNMDNEKVKIAKQQVELNRQKQREQTTKVIEKGKLAEDNREYREHVREKLDGIKPDTKFQS